ncbi:MAG: nucleotidyltransferase domain-containing protein [Gammaproteobacteria bacterium]|nr:nucleotidyltransferase domain-containing protein [Gammaproteobacteria bacterium]
MTIRRLDPSTTGDAILEAMVRRLTDRFNPERILLFGSRATSRATEWSDVDLLVVMPDGTDRRQAAIEMHVALGDLPAAKDIVVTTPAHIKQRGHVIGSVLRTALREGTVLYERA